MTSEDFEEWDERRSTDVAVIQGTKELEELVDSKAVSRLLIRNARRTPVEIEAITGIPATEAIERLEYLLNNPSIRNDLMEEKLILAEINLVVEDIRKRMDGFVKDDEGFASMARVALTAHRLQLDQLDKRRKQIDDKLQLVAEREANWMMAAIRMARELAIAKMRIEFPDADPEIVIDIFDESVDEALAYMEENSGTAD